MCPFKLDHLNFGYEDFDVDDVAEDPFEEEIFDDYFDEEESVEEIDEATERIIEKYEQVAA